MTAHCAYATRAEPTVFECWQVHGEEHESGEGRKKEEEM
jgi:hypothetical protein